MSFLWIDFVDDRAHPPAEEPVNPEIASGVRRLVPRRRRTRGRPDATDGRVATAAGWPLGVAEDPYLEFEPIAHSRVDGLADGDPHSRTDGTRYRAAGSNAGLSEAFDPAEFAEFLEADDSPVPANPAFKERLRQQLWSMVLENADAVGVPAPSRIDDRPWRPRPAPNSKLPS